MPLPPTVIEGGNHDHGLQDYFNLIVDFRPVPDFWTINFTVNPNHDAKLSERDAY